MDSAARSAKLEANLLEVLSMRVLLTEKQQDHLRRVRQTQLAEWRAGSPQVVDELFIEEELVRLMSGMGRAAYLGLDGTVYVGNLGEGELPVSLEKPKDVASCIVRWSGVIGLPELVEALPPIPEDGVVCQLCKGNREMPEWSNDRDDGFRHACMRCGGLGWTRGD
jgi:hypothetical protein